MDELVKPLNEVQIDDTEFACLKAIVFFDPSKFPHLYLSLSWPLLGQRENQRGRWWKFDKTVLNKYKMIYSFVMK